MQPNMRTLNQTRTLTNFLKQNLLQFSMDQWILIYASPFFFFPPRLNTNVSGYWNLTVAISHAEQREVDTSHFMQTAPWLGLLPGSDGQVLHSQDGGDSPIVSLFKSATAAIVSNPGCQNPTSFSILSKQAEAAGMQLNILFLKTHAYHILQF